MVKRDRVTRELTRRAEFPILLIRGAAGCGKSVALRDFLATSGQSYILYDVNRERSTFARFVYGFTEALAARAPGARAAFASAYEKAAVSKRPADDLAAWLHEHIKALDDVIAIDNLHNSTDPLSETFVGSLIDRMSDSVRWIVSTRNADGFSLPSWMAFRWMDVPLEGSDLAFDRNEVAALANDAGIELSAAGCDHIVDETGGWATGVAATMHALATADATATTRFSAFESMIEALFGQCDSWELRALIGTALMPDLSDELLEPGPAREAVANLRRRAPYLFLNDGEQYHDLVADALRSRMHSIDPREHQAAISMTGQALRRRERFVEALELYAETNQADQAAKLLEHHGLRLVEQGYGDVVELALACSERSGHVEPANVLALRAIVNSRLGRFDAAESWFNQALSRAADNDTGMIEIKYLFACDLMRRDRPDALDLLEPHASDEELPTPLRAGIVSALGEAYMLSGNSARARVALNLSLTLAEQVGDDALKARVLARAAYVRLYDSDNVEATRFAHAAADAAKRASAFSVAAAAYSTLYAIADEEEDPVAARLYLDLLLENGLKSGNLGFLIYYFTCAFEIAVERHDSAEIGRIEAGLRSFDLQYDDSYSHEALLPAQALRATWSGEFDYAYRLLFPTAAQQAGANRTAQRWAEVALYAVAARRPADAREATDRVTEALSAVEQESNRTARARLLAYLATALSGNARGGTKFIATLATSRLPKRLASLHAAVRAIAERIEGAPNHDDMDLALRALYANDFGGVARMLEALPLPLALYA
ncbi:MAG TPA: AAA family ATPase [Candidatus Baltobacteraceae bacterium]|jgi:ATP/maltotriose-dependent transcriptional regulator MalT|nr:AAA family ATPase [Candidatus Baltobacteraceae bacterium]